MPCPYECWVKSACHAKRDDRHKFKYNGKPAATAARSQETGPAATNSNAYESAELTSWQAGAQPFDSAPPNLRMNRAAARFTSSAPTNSGATSRRDDCLLAGATFLWERRLEIAGSVCLCGGGSSCLGW